MIMQVDMISFNLKNEKNNLKSDKKWACDLMSFTLMENVI